jgi:hypothetical protein
MKLISSFTTDQGLDYAILSFMIHNAFLTVSIFLLIIISWAIFIAINEKWIFGISDNELDDFKERGY